MARKRNISIVEHAMCKEDHEIEWLIDSACSLHMIGWLEYFLDINSVNHGGHITFGNNKNGIIRRYGVLTNVKFFIQIVAYVEVLKHYLISVWQLCKVVYRVEFDDAYNYIMKKYRSRCIIKSEATRTIFLLDISLVISKPQLCFFVKSSLRSQLVMALETFL